MAELPRPDETATSHSSQIPQAQSETSFLVSLEELIDKRITHIKREQEKKAELVDFLETQVHISNQERDEMVTRHDLKDKELKELQDRHQVEVDELQAKLSNLQSELKEANNQLSQQEALWRKRYDDLERSHQRKLSETIQATRVAHQVVQTALENQLQAELERTESLVAQLGELCDRHTILEESNQLLIDQHTVLVNECTVLERETQGLTQGLTQAQAEELAEAETQTPTPALTEAQTQTPTHAVGEAETQTWAETMSTVRDADGPSPLAPYRRRFRQGPGQRTYAARGHLSGVQKKISQHLSEKDAGGKR